jgi:hypothetical protein
MANKRTRTIAVVLSVIAIAGVAGYLLFRRKKKSQAAPSGDVATDLGLGVTPKPPAGSSTPAPRKYSFPFTTVAEGNAFREWVNMYDPKFAKLIKLDKAGPLNSYLDRAWKKYGAFYMKNVLKK